MVRFEKVWLSQEGFKEQVEVWWNEYQLTDNLGNSWKLKMEFLRKKLRGWNINYRGNIKKLKKCNMAELEEEKFYRKLEI